MAHIYGKFEKGYTYIMSEEHKRKISNALKGNKHGFKKGNTNQKGIHRTEETKLKMSESHKGLNKGDKNSKWKGDNVGYTGLHTWVRKWKPKKEFCEKCNKNKPIDVANISGKYKRDLDDFIRVCRKCHYLMDLESHETDEFGRFIKKRSCKKP